MKKIVEIQSIQEVVPFLDEETHLFFDLDNTLLFSPHEFGSDPWEAFLVRKFMKDGMSEKEAADRATLVWKAFQTVSDISHVEEGAADLLLDLHERGVPIFAITARAPEFRSVTEKQIETLKIRFSEEPFAADNFSKGVFYCGNTTKGEVLKSYSVKRKCQKIVFVDDLFRHLESAACHLEVPFVGLRYAYLDQWKKSYIPCEATHLLAKVFSDPEASQFLLRGLYFDKEGES